MILRRAILVLLVAICGGCALTQWQREQELFAQVRDLNAPAMQAAIEAARPGVPRGP